MVTATKLVSLRWAAGVDGTGASSPAWHLCASPLQDWEATHALLSVGLQKISAYLVFSDYRVPLQNDLLTKGR